MDADKLMQILAVFAILAAIPVFAEVLARALKWLLRRPAIAVLPEPEGRWEVVADENNTEEEGCYRVRWSIPDEKGRYLWVRHYGYGPGGNSSRWSSHAAERNAEQFNKEGRRPWEFRS